MLEIENRYYSEPVQEIMGKIPSKITRWGVTVIVGLFVLLILGCSMIKYPQVVNSTIILTSENPPSDLVARYDGLLDTVCVANGQEVRSGQLIALLATSADYRDILSVRQILSDLSGTLLGVNASTLLDKIVSESALFREYHLGELQSGWSELVRSCRAYQNWIEIDQAESQKDLVLSQLCKSREYYDALLVQKKVMDQEFRYEQDGLYRDSLLMQKGAISRAEYEVSLKNWISKKGSLASFDASLTNTQLSILQLKQRLTELDIQRRKEETEHLRVIMLQTSQLHAQMDQWLEQFAVISPADGIVSLQKVWSPGQHVFVGDVIASVVPDSGEKIIGRLQVPSSGFGKVEIAQTVNVRLNGFPYMEFGILKGFVESISPVPQILAADQGRAMCYTVNVSFPDGLISSYGEKLPMVQQMDGTADIITKDRRLIELFIDPILSLFRNR